MAASPETATTAACSKLIPAGLWTSLSSLAAAYSAKEPRAMPNTSSPGRNLVTPDPTSTTVPATSSPGTRCFARLRPKPGSELCRVQERVTRQLPQGPGDLRFLPPVGHEGTRSQTAWPLDDEPCRQVRQPAISLRQSCDIRIVEPCHEPKQA